MLLQEGAHQALKGSRREPLKGGERPLKGGTNHLLKGGPSNTAKGSRDHTTKGTRDNTVKGGSIITHKGNSAALAVETCNQRIGELEADFKALTEFTKTNWNKFITRGWSVILAKELPQELGVRYSAKQCALNLLALHEETSTT
jgi:hypothetical protein